MEEMLSNIINHDLFPYGLTLLGGIVGGYLLSRWQVENGKKIIIKELEAAQSHVDRDLYDIREGIEGFNGTLQNFAKDFDKFKQTIQEIENRQHVSNYLKEARSDVSNLREED